MSPARPISTSQPFPVSRSNFSRSPGGGVTNTGSSLGLVARTRQAPGHSRYNLQHSGTCLIARRHTQTTRLPRRALSPQLSEQADLNATATPSSVPSSTLYQSQLAHASTPNNSPPNAAHGPRLKDMSIRTLTHNPASRSAHTQRTSHHAPQGEGWFFSLSCSLPPPLQFWRLDSRLDPWRSPRTLTTQVPHACRSRKIIVVPSEIVALFLAVAVGPRIALYLHPWTMQVA